MTDTRLSLILLLVALNAAPLDAQRGGGRGAASGPVLAATANDPLAALRFRSVGPGFTSGRHADMAIDPKNPHIWYVAMAAGGLWKTTNGGLSFTPIFDNYGSYSMCCVLVDPKSSNVVWLATGENTNLRSAIAGEGVFKSSDAGATWRRVGLEHSEKIGRMAIDPRNTDVVWVAAQGPLWSAGGDRGLYKTTDGGQTWRPTLQVSENTGVTDVVLDPRNPDVVYAASYGNTHRWRAGRRDLQVDRRRRHLQQTRDRPPDGRCGAHRARTVTAEPGHRLRVDHGTRNSIRILPIRRPWRDMGQAEQLEHERPAILRRAVSGSVSLRPRLRSRDDQRVHGRRRQVVHAAAVECPRRQSSHRLRSRRLAAHLVGK